MPKKNLQILDRFWLRIIAMTFMVVDHIGVLMWNYRTDIGTGADTAIQILRFLGRIAFPLFILMMAEGMHFTRNGWKYIGRIAIIYGLIIVGITIYIFGIEKNPSLMSGDFPGRNPFTDLILIAFFLFALNSPSWKKSLALIPAGVIILGHVLMEYEARTGNAVLWFPYYLRPDYGVFGLLIAFGFYLARPITQLMAKKMCASYSLDYEMYLESPDFQRTLNIIGVVFYATITIAMWGLSYVMYDPYNMSWQSYCLLAIPFMLLYSGKRGYNAKWFRVFSYAFFPMHLIILFLIFFVSFGHV